MNDKIVQSHTAEGNKCLSCGAKADGSTSIEGAVPKVGDVTVCLSCGHVMEFGLGLTLVELSDATLMNIAGDPDFLKVVGIAGYLRDKMKKEK